jgi:hypothetical protein
MNLALRALPGLLRHLALILTVGIAAHALAGPGHDGGHDHDEMPALTSGPSLPRFEAHSELFEVVGTLNHGELSLTLDAYATNDPVRDARIELESGDYKAVGEFRAEQGIYRFAAVPFAEPGSYPVTLTITAGDDIDLLAADLVVPPAAPASAVVGASAPNRILLWGAGGVAVVLALAFGLRRGRPAA